MPSEKDCSRSTSTFRTKYSNLDKQMMANYHNQLMMMNQMQSYQMMQPNHFGYGFHPQFPHQANFAGPGF